MRNVRSWKQFLTFIACGLVWRRERKLFRGLYHDDDVHLIKRSAGAKTEDPVDMAHMGEDKLDGMHVIIDDNLRIFLMSRRL